MGVSPYGENTAGNQYKTVAQIWQEAAEQGANYRTLTAKHRYNVVKNCSGDDFISETELKKVKSIGKGSFASGNSLLLSRRFPNRCAGRMEPRCCLSMQSIYVSIKVAS